MFHSMSFRYIVLNIIINIYYILGYTYAIGMSDKANYIKIIEYNKVF